MKEIDVNVDNKKYQVYLTSNFDGLNTCLEEHKINEKIMIISDKNVEKLYLNQIIAHIKGKEVFTYIMDEGENAKTLLTINEIYKKCLEYDFNRSSSIIALGGGVVGDTAGFAASTYMRGIKFIQMPTTIIAAVDSSIGGKVAVNYHKIKNLIGNFYHPEFIYINTSCIRTLENKHILSGIAEIIKYALLYDVNFFNYLDENSSGLLNLEIDKLNYVIKKCINAKIQAVHNDFKDEKERRLLNFGHTVGHAVETMSSYEISHGEAVAIGMVFESILSNIEGLLSSDEMDKIFNLIRKYGLMNYFNFCDITKFFDILKHDKKAEGDNLRFVLLEKIGRAVIANNIDKHKILNALDIYNRLFKI